MRPAHGGIRQLVADLNRLYRERGPLHRYDFEPRGFQWLRWDDAENSLLTFVRRDDDAEVIVALNFTPVPRHGYRVGVPRERALSRDLQLGFAFLRRQRCRQSVAASMPSPYPGWTRRSPSS